jgi:hypothetical protein
MKVILPTVFLFISMISCKKTSTTTSTPPPSFSCTTDICTLTYYKWGIASQTITTDLGTYTYTAAQLATIDWATFQFKPDSSCVTYGGSNDTYSYDPSTKKMILVQNVLPIHFDVAFPTKTSMNLTGNKIQMHPRTDSSVETNYAINSIAGGLHNDFGVDTSKIHFMQAVFTYNGY